MMRALAVFFLLQTLSGQTVAVGLKGGVPVTGDMDSFWAVSESRRYAVGPMATLGLGHGFQVEVDALYRRVGYRTLNTDIFGGSSVSRARGNSWEFPMLVRKSIAHGLYAGAGYAPRTIDGGIHSDVVQVGPQAITHLEFDFPGVWSTTHGVVASGGIERRMGCVRFSPEVRYVYWTSPSVSEFGSRGFAVVTSQHEVDLCLGITFGAR